MASIASGAQRAFVSTLALTRTTEWAARRLGSARFLPALFVDRLTHLGGIDRAVFAAQLAKCRSFEDNRWAAHWESFAGQHFAIADVAVAALSGRSTRELLDSNTDVEIRKLGQTMTIVPCGTTSNGSISRSGFSEPGCPAQRISQFRYESQ